MLRDQLPEKFAIKAGAAARQSLEAERRLAVEKLVEEREDREMLADYELPSRRVVERLEYFAARRLLLILAQLRRASDEQEK